MAYLTASPTPNPDSFKFSRAGAPIIEAGLVSFSSPAEAVGHPWAEALLTLEGITNVFAVPQFLTITKRPDASWDVLFPQIERILETHLRELPAA